MLIHLKQGTSKLLFISLHTLTLNWLERRSACSAPSRDCGIRNTKERIWEAIKEPTQKVLLLLEPTGLLREQIIL